MKDTPYAYQRSAYETKAAQWLRLTLRLLGLIAWLLVACYCWIAIIWGVT